MPLIETGEAGNDGADYFVKKYIDTVMEADPEIDTLVLGCTHYPLLLPKIRKFAPEGVNIIAQGEIVGTSLADYMRRHPEIDVLCTKGGDTRYLTTENAEIFDSLASVFMHDKIRSSRISL